MMKNYFALFIIIALIPMFAISCKTTDGPETFSITGTISDPDNDMGRFIGVSIKLLDKAGTETHNENLDLYDVPSSQKTYTLNDVKAGDYKFIIESRNYKRVEKDVTINRNATIDVVLEPIIAISFEPDRLEFGPRENRKTIRLTNEYSEPVHFYIKGSGPAFEFGNTEIADILEGLEGLRRHSWTWGGNLEPGESMDVPVKVFHRIPGDKEFTLNIGTYTYGESTGQPLNVTVSTNDESFLANVQGVVRDREGNALKGIAVYNDSSKDITITNENGEYFFGLIPYRSWVSVSAYSNSHYEQTLLKEYVIDDINVDFTLDPCPSHLTIDRSEIDLGSGPIGSGSTVVELNYKTDLSDFIQLSCNLLDPTKVYPGLNISPASGMSRPEGKIRFSLDRNVASTGSFSFYVKLSVKDAGTYILPVKYSVI